MKYLKSQNLYHLYNKISPNDPYEADLFKAIFQYKVFSKFLLHECDILLDEIAEADSLFQKIQKEFAHTTKTRAVEAQIEYLKFLMRQGNLKGASILGKILLEKVDND